MNRTTIRSVVSVTIRSAAAAIALTLALGPVSATDAPSPARVKHETALQINACMKRRMASDRLVSYNQAAKDCKARLNAERTAPLVAADAKR